MKDWEIAAVGICPICQGSLQVYRENSTGRLFVGCDECLSEWDSPGGAPNMECALRDQYAPCSPVSVDELREHEWFASVINKGGFQTYFPPIHGSGNDKAGETGSQQGG